MSNLRNPPRLPPLNQHQRSQLRSPPSIPAGCNTLRRRKRKTGRLGVNTRRLPAQRDAVNHRAMWKTPTQSVRLRSTRLLRVGPHSVMMCTIAQGTSHPVAAVGTGLSSLRLNRRTTAGLLRDHTLQMCAPQQEILATDLPYLEVIAVTDRWNVPMRGVLPTGVLPRGVPAMVLETSPSSDPPRARISSIERTRSQAMVASMPSSL